MGDGAGKVQVRWDEWAAVTDALTAAPAAGPGPSAAGALPARASLEAPAASKGALVVVCFAQSWSPPSLHSAVELEKFRMGEEAGLAQVFIVDADKESGCAWELGIKATPAIVFYRDGEHMRIRRPAAADDIKLVGSFAGTTLVEAIRVAKKAVAQGEQTVSLDI